MNDRRDKQQGSSASKEIAFGRQDWDQIQFRLDEVFKQAETIARELTDESEDRGRRIQCAVDAVLNGITFEQAIQLKSVDKVNKFVESLSRFRNESFQNVSSRDPAVNDVVASRTNPHSASQRPEFYSQDKPASTVQTGRK